MLSFVVACPYMTDAKISVTLKLATSSVQKSDLGLRPSLSPIQAD